jgi:hypothetical protein
MAFVWRLSSTVEANTKTLPAKLPEGSSLCQAHPAQVRRRLTRFEQRFDLFEYTRQIGRNG